MNRALAIVVALVLGALVASAVYWQRALAAGLPPRAECPTLADAFAQARDEAKLTGGRLFAIVGTGSMAPFIPAATPGLDPKTTVVAYAVGVPDAAFADVQTGKLCVYVAAWDASLTVMHQAAQFTASGWIMTGLHNKTYESGTRVTAANFRGIVAKVWVVKQ